MIFLRVDTSVQMHADNFSCDVLLMLNQTAESIFACAAGNDAEH
jgi:hypothetical protein